MLALALLLLAITYYVSKRATKKDTPPAVKSQTPLQNSTMSKGSMGTRGSQGVAPLEPEADDGSYRPTDYGVGYDLSKVDCCSGNTCLPYTNGLNNGNEEEACAMIQFYQHI